jgi:hypothetical protein
MISGFDFIVGGFMRLAYFSYRKKVSFVRIRYGFFLVGLSVTHREIFMVVIEEESNSVIRFIVIDLITVQ